MSIHLDDPSASSIVRARAYVDGQLARVVHGHRIRTVVVHLRGATGTRPDVRVVARTASGKALASNSHITCSRA